ncbi:MAG: hypothetical protein IJ849_11060 [Selenomonadaceae bacterium]|nr:hypothetical protein [Selenomonadaceae bacterium]
MKILKSIGFRTLTVATALAAVIGAQGSVAMAADGMADFRAAYAVAAQDNRAYAVEIDLLGPAFHADVETVGEIRTNGFVWLGGSLEWDYTDHQTGTTVHKDIPLYLERNAGSLDFYGQRGNSWYEDSFVGLPLWLISTITSRDKAVLDKNMAAVKEVEVLQETDATKVLRLIFDKEALAAMIRAHEGSPNFDAAGQVFAEYLAQGAAATDLTCDVTVKRATNEIVTISADLTKLMQNYAQSLLQGSYQEKVTLTDADKALLQALGYYCNLRVYASATNAATNGHFAQAKAYASDVKGAQKAAGGFLKDLEQEAVSSSVK